MNTLQEIGITASSNIYIQDSPVRRNNGQDLSNDSNDNNSFDTNRSLLHIIKQGPTDNTSTTCDAGAQCSDASSVLTSMKQMYSLLTNEMQLESKMLAMETECYFQDWNDTRHGDKLSTIDLILLNSDLEQAKHTRTLVKNELAKSKSAEKQCDDPEEQYKLELTIDLIDCIKQRLQFISINRRNLYRKCCDLKTKKSLQWLNQTQQDVHSQPQSSQKLSTSTAHHRSQSDSIKSQNVHSRTLPYQSSSTINGTANSQSDSNRRQTIHNQTLLCQSSSTITGTKNSQSDPNTRENVHNQTLPCQSTSTNIGHKRSSSDHDHVAAKRSKMTSPVATSEPPRSEATTVKHNSTELQEREERLEPTFFAGVISMNPGLVGLKNLGNSCYMNSVVQCLGSIDLLRKYFTEHSYFDDTSADMFNGGEAAVTKEFAQVALSKSSLESGVQVFITKVVGQSKLQFNNSDQQDAHEFLTFLLNTMHEELSHELNTQPNIFWTEQKIEWNKSLKNRRSIISGLFFGQYRSHTTCLKCLKSSITYEVFSTLTIPVPNTQTSMKETNGWLQRKNTRITPLLKKFDFKKYFFPGSNIKDIADQSAHADYTLGAIVNHFEVENGGRYGAFCNYEYLKIWVSYDDLSVKECSLADARDASKGHYLIFYKAVAPSDKEK